MFSEKPLRTLLKLIFLPHSFHCDPISLAKRKYKIPSVSRIIDYQVPMNAVTNEPAKMIAGDGCSHPDSNSKWFSLFELLVPLVI